MMTDSITVEFSLSVDTILNIIGGAMIVVTVVVFTVMGKVIYLFFGSDRSPRCQEVRVCVCVSV